jgi:cytidylate kinase
MNFYQIAMDGPAGAGKSTVAKLLAKKLNFTYINSGGMFRSVAIYMLNNNLTPETIEIVRSDILAEKIKINQVKEDFFLNNENITHRLHSPEVSKLVPFISRFPFIRDFVEGNSIKIANTQNIVIEGRDTTTVVFPNATMKC